VQVRLWGTRGSLASPGPDTVRYGGNTACVEVRTDRALLILDAGTGIRDLGASLRTFDGRIDLLLTHLHLDHLQGIGFFAPMFRRDQEVHVWGPPSTNEDLRQRLGRYLSPPLFPVRLRDLESQVTLHDVPHEPFEIGDATIRGDSIIHPGPTLGYRISVGSRSVAYLPDHEPALGAPTFPIDPGWTSGHGLAAGVDVLIHDAQYTPAEFARKSTWGHCTVEFAVRVAHQAGAKRLALFHHDPLRDDDALDELAREAKELASCLGVEVMVASEGLTVSL
jgi:phosphoribosyl 1,2-cyclic phosphodiesterase